MKPKPLKVKNLYPEDVFPEITEEEWKRIDELLKKNMGFSLDRVSANICRRVRKRFLEDIKSACEFYLEYFSLPDFLLEDVKSHKVRLSSKLRKELEIMKKKVDEYNEGPYSRLLLKYLLNYNEWLFKLTFKDVLGDEE